MTTLSRNFLDSLYKDLPESDKKAVETLTPTDGDLDFQQMVNYKLKLSTIFDGLSEKGKECVSAVRAVIAQRVEMSL